MTDDRDDEERVGYGRPPKATRFKPGQSGNPKGRPKGSKNFANELQQALSAKITVTKNGRQVRKTAQQVLIEQLINGALRGNQKAQAMALQAIKTFAVEEAEPDAGPPPTSFEDRMTIENLMNRVRDEISDREEPADDT